MVFVLKRSPWSMNPQFQMRYPLYVMALEVLQVLRLWFISYFDFYHIWYRVGGRLSHYKPKCTYSERKVWLFAWECQIHWFSLLLLCANLQMEDCMGKMCKTGAIALVLLLAVSCRNVVFIPVPLPGDDKGGCRALLRLPMLCLMQRHYRAL